MVLRVLLVARLVALRELQAQLGLQERLVESLVLAATVALVASREVAGALSKDSPPSRLTNSSTLLI